MLESKAAYAENQANKPQHPATTKQISAPAIFR
jgi:hypothetical protein